MSRVVVTAWDAPSGDLVAGLLASLAAHAATRDLPVRVLVPDDAAARGLDQAVAVRLAADEAPDVARTRLPEIVPGFERYLWLAPATWVVDGAAPVALLDAAADGALAGVFEIDRAYRIYASERPPWRLYAAAFARLYGHETMRRQWMRPFVNGAVLALPGDTPHWAAWRDALADAAPGVRPPMPYSLADVALNVALGRDGLPVRAFPATWNWLCHFERPAWDGGRLVEPEPPHAPIRILHLSGQARARRMRIAGLDGGRWSSRLRFPLEIAAEDAPADDDEDPSEGARDGAAAAH
ncbi:MAG: hypothetical protein IT561_02080 [Alphaproteobacteria bacterium]|nr:hypothetical protein [Alphaproteobacteria bacterium]